MKNIFHRIGDFVERRFMGGGGLGGAGLGQTSFLPAPVLSGVAVTPETALTFTSCYACIAARSTDVAALPLQVKRRLRSGGRRLVPNDPRYNLLFCEPNRDTTSVRFRQALYAHRFGHGNGYAEVVRRQGMPVALHLHSPRPSDTWPERSRSGALWYQVDGGRRQVRAEDMVHVAGLGWNGLTGYSVIAFHRQAVGYGMALEQHGAAFYGNAATPKGALKLKREATPEVIRNLRESFGAVHQGTENAHRLMILEEDMDYQQVSISPQDAEYIASRTFQSGEMNKIFEVPPPRTQDFTNIAGVYKALEDLMNGYVGFTLGPDSEIVEQELNKKLFTARERAHGLHVAHDFAALLRGNMSARADYYTKRFGLGSLSPDEIREREGDNPIDGPIGNRYFVMNTFTPLDLAGTAPAAPPGVGKADGGAQADAEDDPEDDTEDDTEGDAR